MAYIECYNTVVYPHQFRLTHDLSIDSFGGGETLDNKDSEQQKGIPQKGFPQKGFPQDELNITELSNMHISHKSNMVMNPTEGGMFNNMYNKALHTAMENKPDNPTLEHFMVKNQSLTATDNDEVFMKDDMIGQYSNNSYEHGDIPPSPSRLINKKNKYNKQRMRTRRRLPDIPTSASSSGYSTLPTSGKVSSSSSNEELQTRSSYSPPEGSTGNLSPPLGGSTSPTGGAGGAAGTGSGLSLAEELRGACSSLAGGSGGGMSLADELRGAGLSLADELREADPGLTLHHVDSNDRIAVINIVYSDPSEEADKDEGGASGGQGTEDESFKRLSWDTDRDRCSVSTLTGEDENQMTRSGKQFDFCDDNQYIDDSPQVFKPKYCGAPYTRQEQDMETSTHSETMATPAQTMATPAETTTTTTPAGNNTSLPGSNPTVVYPGGGAEPTHRGCHKFIPRHKDEIFIEIGDPIYVEHEADDLWCEGVNLRTGKRGIFPSAYATDLSFLAVQDEGGTHSMRFYLQFLGSIQVKYERGTEVLQQAINKVAFHRRSTLTAQPPAKVLVEINEHGVRMTDAQEGKRKSENWDKMTSKQRLMKALEAQKEEAATSKQNHFFPLKNVSFCGFHPRNERYFAFITKHPVENKFACHVLLGDGSTKCVAEAVGVAFRRFYQQYMAFVHPTEDIYMED